MSLNPKPSIADLEWAITAGTDPVSGQANVATPSSTMKSAGWSSDQYPPFNWFNFFMNGVYQWIRDIASQAFSFIGVKTFSDTTESTNVGTGAVVVGGGLGVGKNIHVGEMVYEGTGYRSIYRTSGGAQSDVGIHFKVVEIGLWNMDTTGTVAVETNIPYSYILSVQAYINPDSGSFRRPLVRYYDNTLTNVEGGVSDWEAGAGVGIVNLFRRDTGSFDNSGYSASINRGFLFVTYLDYS